MSKINKSDLIEMVAEKAHLSKRDAKAAIDNCFDLIIEALERGEDINITNFGSFEIKTRLAREGTDPRTHQRLFIKENKTVTFKTSKELKQKINQED